MSDFFYNPDEKPKNQTDVIWKHILNISSGENDITDELLLSIEDERLRMVLGGLQMLKEDLELYKSEFKSNLESEHRMDILEEKNKELAQFTYIASHDLQEPLNTISSFSTLLRENYSDQLDEEGKMYISHIENSSKRMRKLILDLLDYSSVGKNKNSEWIDTNRMVTEILFDYQKKISETQTEVYCGDLPNLWGIPVQIGLLFRNLLSNAIKFSSKSKSPKVSIACMQKGQNNLFCVRDNGIGIDDKYHDKIFQVFQRLHNQNEYYGTGIGLALCQKIVDLHGGEIWVNSELNRGSEFCFTLPFSRS